MPSRTYYDNYDNLVKGVLEGDVKQVQNAIDKGVKLTGKIDYDYNDIRSSSCSSVESRHPVLLNPLHDKLLCVA